MFCSCLYCCLELPRFSTCTHRFCQQILIAGSIKKFYILYKYIGKLSILQLYILLLVVLNTAFEINKTTFS